MNGKMMREDGDGGGTGGGLTPAAAAGDTHGEKQMALPEIYSEKDDNYKSAVMRHLKWDFSCVGE